MLRRLSVPVPSFLDGQDETTLLMWITAAALFAVAAAIGGQMLYHTRRWRNVSLRRILGAGASLLWILPAVGVAGFVLWNWSASMDLPSPFDDRGAETATEDSEGKGIDESLVLPAEFDPDDLEPPPEWVVATDDADSDVSAAGVVSSRQFATVEEAEQDALEEVTLRVRSQFEDQAGRPVDWTPSTHLVHEAAVREAYVEPLVRGTEASPFLVYRVHYRLEPESEIRKAVYPVWREHVVHRRLWSLGGLIAFATLLFGTLAAYLRANQATQGAYANRLRTAALALVTAGGLVVATLV